MTTTTNAPNNRGAAVELRRSVDEALGKLHARRLTDHRIHQSRRALKRARAALRLLRPTLGERVFRAENLTLRDAGRLLSPLRDARAQLETFERLLTRASKRLAPHDLSAVRLSLERDLVGARRTLRAPSKPIARCISLLQAHRQRQDVPRQDVAAHDLQALGRIYRRGRKRLADAAEKRSTEAFHDSRKEVKYLVNGLELFQSQLGNRGEKTLLCADEVGDLLGEDHDLAVLEIRLAGPLVGGIDTNARKGLLDVIARRRSKLQARALKRGERLYRRKSKRFARVLAGEIGEGRNMPSELERESPHVEGRKTTASRRRSPVEKAHGRPLQVSPTNLDET